MDAYMESPRSAKLSIDDTYSSSNNNFFSDIEFIPASVCTALKASATIAICSSVRHAEGPGPFSV